MKRDTDIYVGYKNCCIFLMVVDLRNLLHALEEESEHFIQPVVVLSLIDVQRFLKPLLGNVGTVEKFMKIVNTAEPNLTNKVEYMHNAQLLTTTY